MITNLKNDLSAAAFALSAHVANGGAHAECHAFTAAWLADQLINELCRESIAQSQYEHEITMRQRYGI